MSNIEKKVNELDHEVANMARVLIRLLGTVENIETRQGDLFFALNALDTKVDELDKKLTGQYQGLSINVHHLETKLDTIIGLLNKDDESS